MNTSLVLNFMVKMQDVLMMQIVIFEVNMLFFGLC